MALPNLTPEDRAAALAKAAESRRVRADVKVRLKAGETSVSQIIAAGEVDEAIAKLKVVALLEALPGVGRVKARAIMQEIGIAETRRVRGLGPHQASQLTKRFG